MFTSPNVTRASVTGAYLNHNEREKGVTRVTTQSLDVRPCDIRSYDIRRTHTINPWRRESGVTHGAGREKREENRSWQKDDEPKVNRQFHHTRNNVVTQYINLWLNYNMKHSHKHTHKHTDVY